MLTSWCLVGRFSLLRESSVNPKRSWEWWQFVQNGFAINSLSDDLYELRRAFSHSQKFVYFSLFCSSHSASNSVLNPECCYTTGDSILWLGLRPVKTHSQIWEIWEMISARPLTDWAIRLSRAVPNPLPVTYDLSNLSNLTASFHESVRVGAGRSPTCDFDHQVFM